MPRDLVERLRRFQEQYFPRHRREYRELVANGQHPTTLFIGCSDSRVVPHLLMDSGPGELFIARNVGNLVPPYDGSHGFHGTAAAIEYAVLTLEVSDIVVCGHSHCGAMRALYHELPAQARHTRKWLELAHEARLPGEPDEAALRRVEQRSIVLQLERLLTYPMVRTGVEAGRLFLHGWHYLIEDGRVLVLDVQSGSFTAAGDAPGGGAAV